MKAAVQKKSEESGITGTRWIFRQVIEYCERSFSLPFKKHMALNYLKDLGFTRKRPKQQSIKADTEKKSFSN